MTRPGPVLALVLLSLAATFAGACSPPESYRWKESKRDFAVFQQQVFPVLLRDCGFPTCHGSHDRFFQVWGPGRSRLDPMTEAFDTLTGDEVALSYQLALSMIDGKHPGRSLLLRKPLAIEAGGAGHRGTDRYGRDVYRTVNDQGYLVLARWVFSEPPGTMPAASTSGAAMGTPPATPSVPSGGN